MARMQDGGEGGTTRGKELKKVTSRFRCQAEGSIAAQDRMQLRYSCVAAATR